MTIRPEVRVTHTFLSGKLSSTVIIPIDIAKKAGIHQPCNVTVQERDGGVFIKKLKI